MANASEEPKKPPSIISKLIKKVPLNLIRFWWAFIAAPAVGIMTAATLSATMASTSWTFKTTILYNRVPVESAAEKLYIPPDLKTMATQLKSPVVMQRVVDELELEVPALALSNMLTVEEPKSMQRIGLELGWGDEEKGREVLDKVAESYAVVMSDIRRDVVAGYLKDVRGGLARNTQRMNRAQDAVRTFNTRENVRDAEQDLKQLMGEIGTLEFKRDTVAREVGKLEATKQALRDQLNEAKQEATALSEKAKEEEAAEETLSDNRRRQNRLNELITEERRLESIRAKLDVKQKEFERKLKLFEQGFISRTAMEAIDAEVKSLKSSIRESDKIEEWKVELKRLDKLVVPKANKKRMGSPVIAATMTKIVETDLSILSAKEEIRQLELALAEKRRKINRLLALSNELTALMQEVTNAAAERDTMNEQISALQRIHDYGPVEFSTIAPATSAMHHPSSNKKKLFMLMFLGITVGLCAPFGLLAILLSFKQNVNEGCSDLGLNEITPRKSFLMMLTESANENTELENWTRHTSLRIQQLLPRRGAVVSVFPVTHRRRDVELLAYTAKVLGERDERVLIIETSAPVESGDLRERRLIYDDDTPGAEAADLVEWASREFGLVPVGLFDYLQGHVDSPKQIIAKSSLGDFDLIPVGQTNGRFDRLFSNKMCDLLEQCREDYSVILMYGPELHRTVDVEMQCRHSDGLVVLFDHSEPLTHGVRATFSSLNDLLAPFLGYALRPFGFTAPARPGMLKRIISRLKPIVLVIRGILKKLQIIKRLMACILFGPKMLLKLLLLPFTLLRFVIRGRDDDEDGEEFNDAESEAEDGTSLPDGQLDEINNLIDAEPTDSDEDDDDFEDEIDDDDSKLRRIIQLLVAPIFWPGRTFNGFKDMLIAMLQRGEEDDPEDEEDTPSGQNQTRSKNKADQADDSSDESDLQAQTPTEDRS